MHHGSSNSLSTPGHQSHHPIQRHDPSSWTSSVFLCSLLLCLNVLTVSPSSVCFHLFVWQFSLPPSWSPSIHTWRERDSKRERASKRERDRQKLDKLSRTIITGLNTLLYLPSSLSSPPLPNPFHVSTQFLLVCVSKRQPCAELQPSHLCLCLSSGHVLPVCLALHNERSCHS